MPPSALLWTVTSACVLPTVTLEIVGVPGKAAMVTASEPADQSPVLFTGLTPMVWVIAATLNEYVFPPG